MRKNAVKKNRQTIDDLVNLGYDSILRDLPLYVRKQNNSSFSFPERARHYKTIVGFDKEHFFNLIRTPRYSDWLKHLGFYNEKTKKFIYPKFKFNSAGYRSDEFATNNPSEGIITLGCSDTFGTGQHLEDTWAKMLSNQIGGKLYNLGSPGAGVEDNYLALKHHAHHFPQGTKLFWLVPSPIRMSLFGNNRYRTISPGWFDGAGKEELKNPESDIDKRRLSLLEDYYHNYHVDYNNIVSKISMAMDGVKHICKEFKFELYYFGNPWAWEFTEYPETFETKLYIDDKKEDYFLDRASDLTHLGKHYQREIYSRFFKMYLNRKNTV